MINKILVMNLTRMGDLIQSTPLISSLNNKYPSANITLMVSKEFEKFAERIPLIDEIIAYDILQFNQRKNEGEKISWDELYSYLEHMLHQIIERQFDLVYNLSHSRLSALMIAYMGQKNVRGFYCNKAGDRMTNHPWLQYFGIAPFNRIYNSFNLVDIYLQSIDLGSQSDRVIIKTKREDFASAEDILYKAKIKKDELLIGFQAGSSIEGRRWPTQSFSELGDLLAINLNAKILLFGVASEDKQAKEILSLMKMKHHVINLTGKTSISQLIGLLKRCRYLITNDTGTMHIAAALETKIIGLFFAHAHPPETGPYGEGHLIFQARIPCAPCSYGVECNNVICIQKVHSSDIFSMIKGNIDHGSWLLSDDLLSTEEINIVETCFDEDHLLKFKPLIKRPVTEQDILILSYRKMWLESLNQGNTLSVRRDCEKIVTSLKDDFDISNISSVLKSLRVDINLFQELVRLSKEGIEIGEKIRIAILRKHSTLNYLEELGNEITRLDEQINLLGIVNPQIKPITDMFAKRKENFDDDDISKLAKETIACYVKLSWEAARMDEIISSWTEVFNNSPVFKFHAGLSSINFVVAGK